MPSEGYLQALKGLFPTKLSTAPEVLQKHANNVFYIGSFLPDAIYYAESEEDVINIVNFCVEHKVPLIPYGSGTSTEGHTAAVKGGICLNLSRMNRIVAFVPEDHYVTVEPGIAYNDLNQFLQQQGYHFPVEAGWGASIGGMVSTNASGAGAVDVGSMAKNIAHCEIIGYQNNRACKISTGTKSLKSSAGYHLNHLFVGAEGTLGVITQITLRIRANFSSHKTICCQFKTIHQAIDFVILMKRQVKFRRVELMDILQTNACINYSAIHFLKKGFNTLLMEFSGNPRAIEEEVELVTDYLNQHPEVENVYLFDEPAEITKIWMMRKNALPAVIKLDPSKKAINTDICVPLSKLSECISHAYQILKREGMQAPLVAHVGDGNFHFSILVDPDCTEEIKRFNRIHQQLVEEALKWGGSCTGEHGIGLGKIPYLKLQHESALFMMIAIKQAVDPLNIFNPGKVFLMSDQL